MPFPILLVARGFRNTLSRTAGATHRDLELSMDPLALWGMGPPVGGAIQDVVGGHHAVVTGTPAATAALPAGAATDGATDFAGVSSAAAANWAGAQIAAGGVQLWVKPNTLPPSNAMGLVCKCGAASAAGDFVTNLIGGNSDVLRVRWRNAALAAIDINTPENTIVAGTTYHVYAPFDATGVGLYVNGRWYGKNTGHTTGLTGNTQAWTFAAAPIFTTTGDCALDEVSLYPPLTEAQILALAQKTGLILGLSAITGLSVPEGTTATIDPLATATNLLGIPTLELVTPPALGTVTIVPAAGLNHARLTYAPGGVTVDTAFTFTVRALNSNGPSNTVTVSGTVVADVAVGITNANCYPAAGITNSTPINSLATLQTEVNGAGQGAHFLLASGTYTGNVTISSAGGTAANPVVIRPASPANPPVLTGTWTFSDASDFVCLVGMNFNGGHVAMSGDHNRVDKCEFHDWSGNAVNFISSRDGRVSRCEFHNPTAVVAVDDTRRCFVANHTNIKNRTNVRNRIDLMHVYNYSLDGSGGNNQEILAITPDTDNMRLSSAAPPAGLGYEVLVMEQCLIEGWNVPENEIITIKCGAMRFQDCTFLNSSGEVTFRQAGNVKIISCWFENLGGAGCRIYGDNNMVAGCRFVGSDLEVSAGNQTFDTTPWPGPVGNPPNWAAARNSQVMDCRFDDCVVEVGTDNAAFNTNATGNNLFENHRFVSGSPADPAHTFGPRQAGTTFVDPGLGTFPTVRKITASMTTVVGMAAIDPYC